MWTNVLTFGPQIGGATHGVLSFAVSFTGNLPEFHEDATLLHAILNSKERDARKLVSLTGKFTAENDHYIRTFVKVLIDNGYMVSAQSSGQIFHSWFALAGWLRVTNCGEPWPGFGCNEFCYIPPSDEEIIEPILPPTTKDRGSSLLYIKVGKDQYDEVMDFIMGSKHKWNLFSPHEAHIYAIEVKLKGAV